MENFIITPAQITASSQYDGDHAPNYGRLHYQGNYGTWAAGVNDLNQWIQIDFRVQTTVTYVATQGRFGGGQRVTHYKLQYSNDGNSFQVFKQQGENTDKVKMCFLYKTKLNNNDKKKNKQTNKQKTRKQPVSDQGHHLTTSVANAIFFIHKHND